MDKMILVNQKKASELQRILNEEKVYQGEVDELFNFKKKQKQAEKDSNSNSRKEKIKLNLQDHYFGFIQLFILFAASICLMVVIQYLYYSIRAPQAYKITCILEVYILAIEYWNSHATLHAMFFGIIFWNNTSPVWKTDGMEAYGMMKSHINKNVIANISRSVEYDLGNYTDGWRKIMLTVRIS